MLVSIYTEFSNGNQFNHITCALTHAHSYTFEYIGRFAIVFYMRSRGHTAVCTVQNILASIGSSAPNNKKSFISISSYRAIITFMQYLQKEKKLPPKKINSHKYT